MLIKNFRFILHSLYFLIVPSHVNKLALNVPNNIPKNPPLCSFASFLIVPLLPLSINQILQEI